MNKLNQKDLQALIQHHVNVCVEQKAPTPTPLRILGGGSKDFYGAPLRGEVLSTGGLDGIISYEPSELYITAQAGVTLREIEAVLAEHHQYLAFEAPRLSDAATIGGAVGSALSGPARAASGSVRDFVLGLQMINGRAELLNFGGQVMKNVAGYDVSRVLCGSFGTLGLMTQISLKVLPIPLAEQTLTLSMSQAQAIEWLNLWGATALPLNASLWRGAADRGSAEGELWLRLRGAVAAVDWGVQKIYQDAARRSVEVQIAQPAQAVAFWDALRDQSLSAFQEPPSSEHCLWRLSVPQITPALPLEEQLGGSAQTTLVEWHGAQRWYWAPSKYAQTIRACAREAGGHATLWRTSSAGGEQDKKVGVFERLTKTQTRIQQALQKEFDPWGIFNTGRLEI